MNWFERHLHWTAIIIYLGGCVAVFIGQLIMVRLDFYGDHISAGTFGGISLAILVAVLCVGWAWVLLEKQRSLWWLPLVLFVPLGWIAIFTLKNKSQAEEADASEDQ